MRNTLKYNPMGVAKAEDGVEGRNAFYAVFFYVQKIKSHIRNLKILLLQCRYKGGTAYAGKKILLGT